MSQSIIGPTVRLASCLCGQLSATCTGQPIRISVCHCLACQQRTGSAFGVQARFAAENVQIQGRSREWVRATDSGTPTRYHFCPECGSTVWYQGCPHPDAIAIPVGAFADPTFTAPSFSAWERRKHPWLTISAEKIEHTE